jgi:phage-related protein
LGVAKIPEDAEIDWAGDSKEVLSSWPGEIKQTLGFELRKVQKGENPSNCRPLPGVGKGVCELREQDAALWYRVAYLPRQGNVVYVLRCFTKKSLEIPKKDKKNIEQQHKAARQKIREERKYEDQR